jgi:hypothetical protein
MKRLGEAAEEQRSKQVGKPMPRRLHALTHTGVCMGRVTS